MKHILMKIILVGSILLTNCLFASPVHVLVSKMNKIEYGGGFSVTKEKACYVITPNHVIDFAENDGIRITDSDGKSGKAVLVKSLVEFDVALLKMKENQAIKCGAEWEPYSGTKMLIEENDILVGVKQDNNRRRIKSRYFTSSVSPSYVELVPHSSSDKIERGDSGTTIFVGTTPVGMILSVNPGNESGRAILQSQLHGLFGSDLLSDQLVDVALVPIYYRNRENPYASIAARDLLTSSSRLRVYEATVNPRTYEANIPENADYVVRAKILDIEYKRVVNENYKSERDREKSMGKKLLNSLLSKNESERYYTSYLIDIEFSIHDRESGTVVRNLEREKVNASGSRSRDAEKTAIATAVSSALKKTILESEHSGWLTAKQPQSTNKTKSNPVMKFLNNFKKKD